MLDQILLIDDNEVDNFIHERAIRKLNCCEAIFSFQLAEDAISFLEDAAEISKQLIFIDINMPKINGWDFLETLTAIFSKDKSDTTIILLSTSLNPDDAIKAQNHPLVSDFKNKPLTPEMMKEILKEYC